MLLSVHCAACAPEYSRREPRFCFVSVLRFPFADAWLVRRYPLLLARLAKFRRRSKPRMWRLHRHRCAYWLAVCVCVCVCVCVFVCVQLLMRWEVVFNMSVVVDL